MSNYKGFIIGVVLTILAVLLVSTLLGEAEDEVRKADNSLILLLNAVDNSENKIQQIFRNNRSYMIFEYNKDCDFDNIVLECNER